MSMRNNFDSIKPYKVVSVHFNDGIRFKIIQPLKLWVFGYTQRHYPVVQWKFRHTIKQIIYFKDEKEVNEFIMHNTVSEIKVKERIVFDSLKN